MALLERLQGDIKNAMKAGMKDKVNALRFLHAKVKDAGINARRAVNDDDVVTVGMACIKNLAGAIGQYTQGGRADLVAKAEKEIEWYKAYMPAALSPEEIRTMVREIIVEVKAQGAKDLGKVMRPLMTKIKGRADGREVTGIVQKLLI
jgi:uncharacterized protein YqeY